MSKLLREIQRLAVLPTTAHRGDDAWKDVATAAYVLIRDAIDGDGEITPLEAWELADDGTFDYRIHGHTSDGSCTVYVIVRQAPSADRDSDDLEDHQDARDPESAPERLEVDLDEIALILRRDHGLADAYVEQTGGGCATLYAGQVGYHECTCPNTGKLGPHDDGCPVPARGGSPRYGSCAGPGWFTGPAWTGARADLDDFYVGPDDQGETSPVMPLEVGARTEADIAKLIAAQASLPAGEILNLEALAVLGFRP
jgi:hypothetical protein